MLLGIKGVRPNKQMSDVARIYAPETCISKILSRQFATCLETPAQYPQALSATLLSIKCNDIGVVDWMPMSLPRLGARKMTKPGGSESWRKSRHECL